MAHGCPPLQAGGKPKLKKRTGAVAAPAEEKKVGISSELAAKLNRRRRQQGEATDGRPRRMADEEMSDPEGS